VYVRVDLMQGVLAYHRGEFHDAASTLRRAEALRCELVLCPEDEEKVSALLALGVSQRAARASLVACGKDVELAAAHALERAAAGRARAERRAAERAMHRFGKTASGRPVSSEALEAVCGLGYAREAAAEALRRSENEVDAAVGLLCEPGSHDAIQMELLRRQRGAAAAGDAGEATTEDAALLSSLSEMGFESSAGRAALRAAGNDLARAVASLTASGASAGAGSSAASGGAWAAAPRGDAAPEAAAAPALTAAEAEAIERADLHAAVAAAEEEYEVASLTLEALALEHFLGAVAAALGEGV
jgi:hypothetical protein